MSRLRKQIESSQAAYTPLKYPGDLAQDVLGRRLPIARWLMIAAPLAAAAVVAIAVLRPTAIEPPPGATPVAIHSPVESTVVATTEEPSEASVDTGEMTTMVQLPDDVIFSPEYQSISFDSVPSFPSWDSVQEHSEETTSQSKESV